MTEPTEIKKPDGVSCYLTPEEGSLVLTLIAIAWQTATLGSRQRFDLLSRLEDKMLDAGAEPHERPLLR